MKVQEYRDLMDNVGHLWASCRSGATDDELESECARLEKALNELRDAPIPRRLIVREMHKSAALQKRVRQHLFTVRMYLNCNQRIGAEYFGTSR